jgi:glutathione peroxidase
MDMAAQNDIYRFDAMAINGSKLPLGSLRGRVLLIVNTASQCGFTPQFAGLQQLWADYRDRGLTVVGFPSNEFGRQDPGSNDEIARFCETRFAVDFPMMAKVQVNGDAAHPLYQWLKAQAPGLLGTQAIKWNFTKFLVGRSGAVLRRYAPTDAPDKLRRGIESALAG